MPIMGHETSALFLPSRDVFTTLGAGTGADRKTSKKDMT